MSEVISILVGDALRGDDCGVHRYAYADSYTTDPGAGAHGDRDGGAHGDRDGGSHCDRDSGSHCDRDGGSHCDRDGGAYGDRNTDYHADGDANSRSTTAHQERLCHADFSVQQGIWREVPERHWRTADG